MNAPELNPVIHPPNRLQICAFLEPLAEVEFLTLRDYLDVSDSVLSKQIRILQDAGYVNLAKRTENGRQRTWLSLTAEGRKAYRLHVRELLKLVG